MPVYKIQKRNGVIVDFDVKKIENAVAKAAKAVGYHDPTLPPVLSQDISVQLEELFPNKIPTVEETQDIVEDTLIRFGYADIAKAYILYSEKRREARDKKNVAI